jgi:hypothetical protein
MILIKWEKMPGLSYLKIRRTNVCHKTWWLLNPARTNTKFLLEGDAKVL